MNTPMRAFLCLSLAAAALGFSGCDTDVKIADGKIPAELLPYAQALTGEYRGQFERRAMNLTASIDGENRLTLSPSADLVDPSCSSKVGFIKKISYKEVDKKVVLTGAVFDFDANYCSSMFVGKLLYVDFTGTEPAAFNVQLLDHYETQERCDWYTPNPPYAGGPTRRCWYETYPLYLNGRFVKN